MAFNNATAANIATLARVSGLEPLAAAAWLNCEEQSIANPTNPLNVRFWGRASQLRGPGATGAAGVGFAAYASPSAGLEDAWQMLASLAPSFGYGAIVSAAAGSDPFAQARAIELSQWAAGHYGGSDAGDGCLRSYVRSHQAPAPAPGPTPGDAVQTTFIITPAASIGSLVVSGDGHYYLRLADATLHPAPNGWAKPWAIGPVTLQPPIPGGTPGADRSTAYLVGDEAAAFLKSDVTFTPAPVTASADDPAADLAEQKAALNTALDNIAAAVAANRPA